MPMSVFNTSTGSCQQYGHSCLGGHGKRAGEGNPSGPSDPSDPSSLGVDVQNVLFKNQLPPSVIAARFNSLLREFLERRGFEQQQQEKKNVKKNWQQSY